MQYKELIFFKKKKLCRKVSVGRASFVAESGVLYRWFCADGGKVCKKCPRVGLKVEKLLKTFLPLIIGIYAKNL